MKTKTNSRMMAAAVVGMMALAGACGTPDDDTDELGAAQDYAKAKGGSTPTPPPAPVYALKTTDAKVAGVVPAGKTTVRIATTVDLFVAVDYQNVTGAHTQLVQLFSPDGSYYQGFSRSVCIGPACTTDLPEVVGTVAQYWVTVPVAGSYISQYSLTGTWRVDLYVDGTKTATANIVLQ